MRGISETKAALPEAGIALTGAMVPIVEQRDIPFGLDTQQELPERSMPFGKLCVRLHLPMSAVSSDKAGKLKPTTRTKSEQSLVFHFLRTADHVSTVALRQFVITQVVALHTLLFQYLQELRNLLLSRIRRELERQVHLSGVMRAVAVDKLCSRPRVYHVV